MTRGCSTSCHGILIPECLKGTKLFFWTIKPQDIISPNTTFYDRVKPQQTLSPNTISCVDENVDMVKLLYMIPDCRAVCRGFLPATPVSSPYPFSSSQGGSIFLLNQPTKESEERLCENYWCQLKQHSSTVTKIQLQSYYCYQVFQFVFSTRSARRKPPTLEKCKMKCHLVQSENWKIKKSFIMPSDRINFPSLIWLLQKVKAVGTGYFVNIFEFRLCLMLHYELLAIFDKLSNAFYIVIAMKVVYSLIHLYPY